MSYSNESGSSDSSRVSSGSSDSVASKPRNAIADINYELKPLSFSGYKHDHKDPNEFGVEITNFDPSKLSVKRNEENPCNWDILRQRRVHFEVKILFWNNKAKSRI